MQRQALTHLVTLGMLLLVGCGGSDLPTTAYVEGHVEFDGQPLPNAIVSLTPTGGGRPARGVTDKQGWFELTTFSLGDGALLGEHRVSVNPVVAPPASYVINPKRATGYKPPFPDRYWSPSSSGLTATVSASEDNEFKFELNSSG